MASNAHSANPADTGPDPGPTAGLLQSLRNLLGTIAGVAHTRLELLTTEVQEEIHRAAQIVIWGSITAFAVLITVLLASLSIVFAFWDTHRVLAALIVTLVFAVASSVAINILLRKVRSKPRILDATLIELARDREQLRN